jgi:hypothetical protein
MTKPMLKSGMSIARSSYSISTGRLRADCGQHPAVWQGPLWVKADMCAAKGHVCFNPESGHVRCS